MPLNTPLLEQSVLQLLQDMMLREQNSLQEFAHRLTMAIDSYVRSATITVPSNIPVSTTGTAAAQSGMTTAPVTASIL